MYGRKPRTTEVILNVYDLTPMNEWVHPIGMGAYHSGLEVEGREYTYGGGGGIFDHDPRKAHGAHFREAVSMGSFAGEPGTLARALDALREEFGPDRYNILMRNCNTFSSALCEELLGRPIPGYVNRLAWMGSYFSCLMPKSMLEDAPVNEGTSTSGFSVHAPPGRAITAGGGARTRGVGAGSYNAFQGSGMSLAAASAGSSGVARGASAVSSGGREGELSDRRERMRAAALRRAEAMAAGGGETQGGVGGAGGGSGLKSS
ncbi:unnamed protein product [Ascophyllum nodosum]